MGNRTKSRKAKKERSDDESEIFTGGKDGISWHEFDSIMGDWLLENYGSRFGEQLWSDKWIDLMKLDLSDDTDEYEYEQGRGHNGCGGKPYIVVPHPHSTF